MFGITQNKWAAWSKLWHHFKPIGQGRKNNQVSQSLFKINLVFREKELGSLFKLTVILHVWKVYYWSSIIQMNKNALGILRYTKPQRRRTRRSNYYWMPINKVISIQAKTQNLILLSHTQIKDLHTPTLLYLNQGTRSNKRQNTQDKHYKSHILFLTRSKFNSNI